MSKKTTRRNNDIIFQELNNKVNGESKVKEVENYIVNKEADESQVKFTQGESVFLVPLDLLVPSSDDVNVFDPWDEETMLVNKESIRAAGLYNPIIIVENAPNEEGIVTYTILAGHNRFNAYKELLAEAIESSDEEDVARFSVIPSFIKPVTLSEDQREEIVVETNVITRAKLGKKEEMMAYQKTAKIFERRKTRTGEKLSEMIKARGIKKSTFYEALKITELPNELSILYYKEKIAKKSALRLAGLSEDVLTELMNKYTEQMDDVTISLMSKKTKVDDLATIFEEALEDNSSKVVLKSKKFEVAVEDEDLFEEWFEKKFSNWKNSFEKYKAKKG